MFEGTGINKGEYEILINYQGASLKADARLFPTRRASFGRLPTARPAFSGTAREPAYIPVSFLLGSRFLS